MSILKNQSLYKKAETEASLQHCTVDELIEKAVEIQLAQLESVRKYASEKAKGASKAKALAALRKFKQAGQGDPLPGDEL